MSFRAGFSLLAAAALLTTPGCSKRGHASGTHESIAIALSEPVSLDPLFLQGLRSYEVSELGFSYLTNYDTNGNSIPDIAAVVPSKSNGGISPDGRRITYRLRKGVRWQDGAPLTSRDVVFTYRAIMNPGNAVPSRYGYDRVGAVIAADPYTVVVRLAQPFSPIVTSFFGGDSNVPILPSHLLQRFGSLNSVAYNQLPIGSGPYRFERWQHGDRLSLAANPSYYAGTPALQRLDLRFIPDASTILDQLQTGEVDAAFFADVSKIQTLRGIPGHRVVVTPVPFVTSLSFNLRDPLVGDAHVRRAFALAIDRRALVDKTTHGVYDAGTGMRGLFTWAYDRSAGNIPYDPSGAAKLLQAGGWAMGSNGVRSKNGHRLEIQLADYTGSPEPLDAMATVIAAQERAIGIGVTLKRYSLQQFFLTTRPIDNGRYQVALEQYQSGGDPDAAWLLACDQAAPRGFNDAFYCNRSVDAALKRARVEFDRPSRKREYALVQRRLLTDLPYYLLAQVGEVDVVPDWLEGYERPFLSPLASVARWRAKVR